MKTIYKILSLLNRRQKNYLLILYIMNLIVVGLELLGIGIIVPIIYTLMNSDFFSLYPSLNFLNSFLGYPDQAKLLKILLFLIFSIFLFKNLYLALFNWFETKFVNKVREDISLYLFKNFIQKNLDFHLKTNSSVLLTLIRNDLAEYTNGLQALITLLTELSIILAIIIFLIFYEPQGFIIAGSVMGFFSILLYLLTSGRFKKLGKERQAVERTRTKKIIEGLSGIKEIKVFNIEKITSLNYKILCDKLAKLYSFSQFMTRIPKIYFELIAVAGVVVLTFLLINKYEDSAKILTTLGVFSVATFKLLPSLNKIQNSLGYMRFIDKAVLSLNDFIDKDQSNQHKKRIDVNSKIELSNIYFKYQAREKNVLENINLNLKIGEKIAITGHTGSGKSTLIDLILGLQSPDQGEIKVDGKIVKPDSDTWLTSIGYVPQNIYLFDETIEYNITLKDKNTKINKEYLDKILNVCQLDKFTNSLKEKLDTKVGEKGVQISGGQKQRIGIARALYKNPKIIIFDEATNSLDNKTEEALNESLSKNFNDKAFISITHKIIDNSKFDKVYKIQNGKIQS